MRIETDAECGLVLSEVFLGIKIKTEEGLKFGVVQRDLGVEVVCPDGSMVAIGPRGASVPSASEALFAFMAWLTTRDEVAGPFSSRHDSAPAAELIKEYCSVQGWAEPRSNWIDRIKAVPTKEPV